MKIITFFTAILFVLALPTTSELSAKDATDTTDSAQEEITDQRQETMNTAKEVEDYTMTSHFTGLGSTGDTAPESGESTTTPSPVGSQHSTTTIAFRGYLNLPDDGKIGDIITTVAPSFLEFQPTSTPLSAFPSETDNLLQQSTEAAGTAHGRMQTLPSQHGEFMVHTDIKNFEEQKDEDIVTEVPGSNDDKPTTTTVSTLFTMSAAEEAQAPTISPSMLFTAPAEVDNHVQQNGSPQNTALEAKYDDNTTIPQYVPFILSADPNNSKEWVREFGVIPDLQAQEVGKTTTSPSTSFKIQGDCKDIMQKNGEPSDTVVEANHDETETSTTNNSKEQNDEFSAITASSAQAVETTTNSQSELFTAPDVEDCLTQLNVETTSTTLEADYGGMGPTTPQYEHFISHSGTINSKDHDGEFHITTASSAQEIGTTTTSPSALSTITSNDVSVTQQNGEHTSTTFEVDCDAEVTTTPQYVHFTSRTGTKNSNEQDDEFNAITASSAQGIRTTTTSPIPDDGAGLTEHDVEETTIIIIEVDCDDIESTTPQYEDFIPYAGTKNSMDETGEIDFIKPSVPQDYFPANSSPSMRLTVKADNEKDAQLEGESVATTVAVHQEDNLTIMSSLAPFAPPDGDHSMDQHSGGPNITLMAEPNKDAPTTTPSSTWFPLTVDKNNLTVQSDESKGTRILEINNVTHTTMTFLTIFKILAANDRLTLMSDERDVTTVSPVDEETFSTAIAKQDTTNTPSDEEIDGNETESQEPTNTERSPEELEVLYKIHTRMLKAMSITLGAVVALILLKLGCKYFRKHRRGDRTAVPPETAGRGDAGQPSTSQASTSQEPRVRFQDLLAREDN